MVELTNQGALKPSLQVNAHTYTCVQRQKTHWHTNTLTCIYISLPPSGKSYFVCDHQRSVFLYLCALNRTCSLTGYPCSSYSDFIDGRCLHCEAFKPASCPVLGRWLNHNTSNATCSITVNNTD